MSQRQLSEASGVPIASINGMMAGKKSYSTENLIAVSDSLGVSLDYLLRGVSSPGVALDSVPSTVVLDGAYRIILSRLDIPQTSKKGSSK